MANQSPDQRTRMVLALQVDPYDFLGELVSRALANGLIAPDELPVANMLWMAYRSAATVNPPAPEPPPPQTEGSGNVPDGASEEVSHE